MSQKYLPMLIILKRDTISPKMGERYANCNKIQIRLLHGNPQKSSGLIPTVTDCNSQLLHGNPQKSATFAQL